MMKEILKLLVLLVSLSVYSQNSYQKFLDKINQIDNASDAFSVSEKRGKLLVEFYESQKKEAKNINVTSETLELLNYFVDYDSYAGVNFLLKLNSLDDSKYFLNALTIEKQKTVNELIKYKLNNYNSSFTAAYPANAPKPGFGLKGVWKSQTRPYEPNVTNPVNLEENKTGKTAFLKGVEFYQKSQFKEALEWYTKASNQGYADAMASIGLLYLEGKGVENSFIKALEWYEKAGNNLQSSNTNYSDVIDKLSKGNAEYLDGNNFYKAKNYNQAKILFQNAINKGNEKAYYMLGTTYYFLEDYKNALIHFLKAKNIGFKDAEKTLEVVENEILVFNENGKFGLKFSNNQILIAPKYDVVKKFSDGLAVVCIKDGDNQKCGYIDYEDNMVIPLIYGDAIDFSEGLAAVRPQGKTWDAFYGFIDKKGKLIIPHQYPFSFDFDLMDGWRFVNGKAKVYCPIQKKNIYIDKKGIEIK